MALAWLCLIFFGLLIVVSVHDAWVSVKYNGLLYDCNNFSVEPVFVPQISVAEVLKHENQ